VATLWVAMAYKHFTLQLSEVVLYGLLVRKVMLFESIANKIPIAILPHYEWIAVLA
jgi:hypothetical protein